MDTKELLAELTDRIQKTANVRAVFGDPIREGAVTLIPVARVVVRGGGGGSRNKGKPVDESQPGLKGTGLGMGLNIISAPVGFIRVIQDRAEFQPVIDRNRAILTIAVASAMAMWAVACALRAVRR